MASGKSEGNKIILIIINRVFAAEQIKVMGQRLFRDGKLENA